MKPAKILEMSNSEYHGEREHLSSSNFKTLLKDPSKFYREKILGESREVSDRTQKIFDEGTLAHTLILEPHLVNEEFAIFDGFVKSGNDWKEFKDAHAESGKILVSKAQYNRVSNWVNSFNNCQVAVDLVSGGIPEQTLFSELCDIPAKVRCDYINVDKGYIIDLKTTSSPTDLDSFKYTCNSFGYDISAALYTRMFEEYYGKPFEFYFIVLGKRDLSCEIYQLSEDTRELGTEKLLKAVKIYKECKSTNDWSVKKFKKFENNSDYEILKV